MDKVSIMIMSRNSRDMLKECLDRIKKYTPIPHEVILVDDASEIPYNKEEFPDCVIVNMPRRSNCCALRNVGMDMAKTELVFWLDNDTMVSEDWYKPLLEVMASDPKIGLTGQPEDARLNRKPFLPLTQKDCMIENQFAFDYDHKTGNCDWITSYCVLVRRAAYRPTYCYNMPTPCLDPELGAMVKANGYRVVVANRKLNISHKGSQTERPGGRNYLYHLSRNFTRWWKFWEAKAPEIFELYKGIKIDYSHDGMCPGRQGSLGLQGDYCLEMENPPAYDEA